MNISLFIAMSIILCAGCVSTVCGPRAGIETPAETRKAPLRGGGWVYIITNPRSFGRGVYKIGMTQRPDPAKRIDELGGTAVPYKFTPVYLLKTDSPRELEAFFHHSLDTARLSKHREFFRLSSGELKRVLIDARAHYIYRKVK